MVCSDETCRGSTGVLSDQTIQLARTRRHEGLSGHAAADGLLGRGLPRTCSVCAQGIGENRRRVWYRMVPHAELAATLHKAD